MKAEQRGSALVGIPGFLASKGSGGRSRTWHTMAAKRWRWVTWISGEGRYASVSWCPGRPTVMLHGTLAAAEKAKKLIDDSACGGCCTRRHEIVDLGEWGMPMSARRGHR